MESNYYYLKILQGMVKEKRYIHTIGVINEAKKLAKLYNYDESKAEIAATLHDMTKYFTEEEHKELILRYFTLDEFNELPKGAYHAYSGMVFAKDYLGIDDIDILNAIKSHTIGRVNMDLLEKIIYVADFIEPNRTFIESGLIRDIAYKSLDEAVYYEMKYVIEDLKIKDKYVPKQTFEALKYYEELLNGRKNN
ncbi:MAG: bis(5'-nucleosyl)-tetraphosphatase (symmetrical) YqeK [Gammaproteobacteria bacterium]|nr:bis(5'-nucleosyl)-tetraphosphatase (symmetrical) YqeK [Gammaproteobacteria bacterium]